MDIHPFKLAHSLEGALVRFIREISLRLAKRSEEITEEAACLKRGKTDRAEAAAPQLISNTATKVEEELAFIGTAIA